MEHHPKIYSWGVLFELDLDSLAIGCFTFFKTHCGVKYLLTFGEVSPCINHLHLRFQAINNVTNMFYREIFTFLEEGYFFRREVLWKTMLLEELTSFSGSGFLTRNHGREDWWTVFSLIRGVMTKWEGS
mmetsp:Transcript_46518/g.53631  ORF Transcript_46518/g.53631 Transcript_46518/m.53631 type:complete len:129 (-) Transcript_46518:256-642(-)